MPRSISVAMIVKDESAHLAECLAGLTGLADEICVVDTGSRDETVEIARQHHTKVSFFLWCDDFSAARNESLRMCTKDWILVLDADERIAQGDIAVIKAMTDASLSTAFRFLTRNYTNTTSVSEFRGCPAGDPLARGFVGWYPSYKVRLFPNRTGATFEGRVHELVNSSLERQNIKIEMCPVPIHHYAYTRPPKRLLEKQELYLHLGQQKVMSAPNPKAYAELGNQYAEMHDYVNAAVAYRESLKLDGTDPVVFKDLGGMLHLLKRSEEAKKALRIALQLNPGLSEAWRNLGVVFADEKQWQEALECFHQGLALDPEWGEGHRYVSVALEGTGKMAEAAEASRLALVANPESMEALKLYIHQMLRLERRAEAREFLSGLLAEGAHNPELYNALGELCFYDNLYDEALTHFQEACRNGVTSAYNNLGVVLYRQKRYGEARAAFENCLIHEPNNRGARKNLQRTLVHLGEAE